MKGHFSYNDALDMTIKTGEKQSYDPNRMYMIADIYFPELSEHIKSLVSLNGEVLSFRDKYKHKYNSGLHKDEKTAAEYLVEIDKLIAAAKALETEVASAVKRV